MWSSAWKSRFGWPSALDPSARRLRDVAGQVGAVVAAAVDEGVDGLAVRRDGGDPDGAVLVGDVLGLADDAGAGLAGLGDALVDVGHLERDVDDAVAVAAVVVGQRAVGVDRAVDDELDRAGPQHEGLVVAVAVLRAGVGDELHAPRGLVVVRGLGRVADHEDDRVPAGDREDVAVLVVLHQPDELLELLEGEVGLELVVGEGGVGSVVMGRDPAGIAAECATVRRNAVQPVQNGGKPWTISTAD